MYKLNIIFMVAVAGAALSQTKVDLQRQARQIDFTTSQFTKPVRLVATLPATCQLGEMAIVTAVGGGLYFCGDSDIWLSAGSAAGGVSPDFATTLVNETLHIGTQCVTASPCRVRIGSTVVLFDTGGAEVAISAGSGLAHIYFSAAGQLTVGHTDLTLSCTNCILASGVTGFPPDSLPLYTWSASNGQWLPTGSDLRAALARTVVRTGLGLVAVDDGFTRQISIDATVVPGYRAASSTLTFGSIAAGQCAATQNIAVADARPGDAVAPAWPELAAGLQGSTWVSANDTVTIRLCNWSAAEITPGTANYGVSVLRPL